MFESYLAPAARVAAIATLLVSPLLAASPASARKAPKTSSFDRSVPRARHADGSIVRRGDTGGTVKKVQRQLGLEPDGIYGMQTARAVDAFQAFARLHRSGRVDRSTWRALFRLPVGSAGNGAEPDESGGTPPEDPEPEPAPQAPAPGTGACSTTLSAPLRGTKSSGFGDGRNHAGIDLTAPVGTAVRSVACGVVTRSGSYSGYGKMVCIRHTTAFVTCYAHLSSMAVAKGTVVGQGQVIGRVGMTGRTSGPHLHFETRVTGKATDPEPYLAGARTIPGTVA